MEGSILLPVSSNAATIVVSNGEDFISELPDALLHHILSYLDMIYVIQIMVLSRRWRYLCTSLPFLNLNEKVYNECCKKTDIHFKGFVNWVLSQCCSSIGSDIHTFSLNVVHETSALTNWIKIAVARNVVVLDCQLEIHSDIPLPHCFFTCQSLKTFKLNVTNGSWTIFKIPEDSSVNLPCLKSLHLNMVPFIGGGNLAKFFSGCPVLETLVITKYWLKYVNDFIILAPELKNLVMGTVCVSQYYSVESEAACSNVTVFAPKLKSFTCNDLIFGNYVLSNVFSIVEAEINPALLFVYTREGSAKPWCWRVESIENIVKLLIGLCNVRSLTIAAWVVKCIFEIPTRMRNQLPQFCNIKCLKLKTWGFRSYYHGMMYLLEKCPNVETLVLEKIKPPFKQYPFDDEPFNRFFKEAEDTVMINSQGKEEEERLEQKKVALMQCTLSHLKYVEIWNVAACDDELDFLKILLKNAIVLEKVVVFTSKESPACNEGKLKIFMEKLITFPTTSSSVEFVY